MIESTKNSLFKTVHKIASALTSTLKEDEILDVILKLVGEIFNPENWSILLYDKEKDILSFRLVVGDKADKLKDVSFPADHGVAGLCLKTGEPVIIPDASKDERVLDLVDEKEDFKVSSIIAIPMYSKDKPLGVIELVNADEHCFSDEKIELLKIFADFASIAVENAGYVKIIEEKSTLDDCTDLYNSRYMYTILENEIARSKRTGEPFGLVFFDLDHFKNVNDNYGHLVGSQLLRDIAGIIKQCIRPTDWGVRYGGDEFLFILPGAGLEVTMKITERIKDILISKTFFAKDGYNIKLTASFGVAVYPDHASSVKEIIKAGDMAMYKAKETGRDKICTN
jgi:diguanylate cyclase (GGDEF)-like protein